MKSVIFLASALSLFSIRLQARPQVESIAHGDVTVHEQGKEMVVHASNNAIINYRNFDVQVDEAVWFQMKDPSHRVLNRVHSSHPSYVDGRLISNGMVYLLNPAGVVFGPHSIVDVSALVVAAAHLSDHDFLQGRDNFQSIYGKVEVLGHLSAKDVTLVGAKVIQNGKIDARTIIYSVGDRYYLGKEGEHLYVKCDKEALENDENSSLIASGTAESYLLHHGGISKADSVQFYGGEGSKVHLSGTMDVSHRESDRAGGTVVVQGEKIEMRKAHIDVTGKMGGGTVFIGGGENGKGLYPTALEVDCDSLSTVAADALVKGDGGKIVLFGEKCKANGLYSVMGGIEGGSAGVIETSGSQFQSLATRCRMFAPNGKAGVWKIDPYSIQIVDMGGAVMGDLNDGSNNSYVVNSSVINNAPAGSTIIFAANNSTGYTPGTCSIALGTPTTPANISSVNPRVTLIFNTTESPTVRGMMTMNGSINSDTIVFSTPVTLTGNTQISASNSINLNFDVNGPWNLNVTAQNSFICQGSIGNREPLAAFSLTTPSHKGSFNLGNLALSPASTVHAQGNISIGAALTLLAPASFISNTGGILFNNTIAAQNPTSQENLTLSALGDIVFNGTVGVTPLGGIVIENANNVHLKTSALPLSSGEAPHFIRCRSFTQLAGTGSTLFEGSLITTGVPFITRNPSQDGGAVYINTTGDINFYYLVNKEGFSLPVLSTTDRPYYKSVINTTGARVTAPGNGFHGGDVTLIGNSVNLLGVYAGGTAAFPGSEFAGGKGGDVQIQTTAGLHLRGPILATGGAGINGGGQVLPTLLFSGQDLTSTGSDSPGNITLTGPISIGFNGVVLRGQNIQGASIVGEKPHLLAIDSSTNGIAKLGSLSNLSYFVVDYAKGVEISGPAQAQGIALFNSGEEGIVFKGAVTADHITSMANRFRITFAEGYTAKQVSLFNCSGSSAPAAQCSSTSSVATRSDHLKLAGVYAPSMTLVGDISFDTSTSLFSVLRLLNSASPFAEVFNLPSFMLNYLKPPQTVPQITEGQLQGKKT